MEHSNIMFETLVYMKFFEFMCNVLYLYYLRCFFDAICQYFCSVLGPKTYCYFKCYHYEPEEKLNSQEQEQIFFIINLNLRPHVGGISENQKQKFGT